jgi:hypothetical protein
LNPIPIFIPFVNRQDLLEKAVGSVPFSAKWMVEIINNSGAPVPPCPVSVVRPSVPLTASQTLNYMQMVAKSYSKVPFYLFLHNDAEPEPGTVEGLYEMALNAEGKWSVIFTHYDTLAAFNVEAFDAVGGWDTNLPQYFTDNDMYRRLRLAGYPTLESNLAVKHVGSQTILSDPLRQMVNNITFPVYAQYYERKWGGSPGNETFMKPWNGIFE